MGEFEGLPEPCIATILSHTTPIDTCRLSLVLKIFHSASNSNAVWNHFLPSDSNFIDSIISRFPSLANLPSKKALFRAISDRLIIIDDGKKVFFFVTADCLVSIIDLIVVYKVIDILRRLVHNANK
jgi:hypothetical protein